MGKKKEILGIVGGMGPAATIQFMNLVVGLTPAKSDQDHIRMLVDMNPAIPDRTACILGQGPSPVPELVKSAQLIEQAGATFLVFPCNTAHYFVPQVESQIGIPILNMIEQTAAYIKAQGIKKIVLLATDGTLQSRIYQKALTNQGLSCLVPLGDVQQAVMKTIYDIKAGCSIDTAKQSFAPAISWSKAQGAEAVIAGCTELSLIMTEDTYQGLKVVDAMKVVAYKVLERVL
ncbi:MAG: aspartate/glutamate racemase family protein [bacterium]|jgi:aspartate racemase